MDLLVCGAVPPGVEFALRFTITRLLLKEVLTPLIILRHFALSVTEDSETMSSSEITSLDGERALCLHSVLSQHFL